MLVENYIILKSFLLRIILIIMIYIPQFLENIQTHWKRSDVVRTWLRKFPDTYFAVLAFDQKQLEGLQAIPLNKLLLETDATYFPLGGAMVSTPAYLGDVAAYLSNI